MNQKKVLRDKQRYIWELNIDLTQKGKGGLFLNGVEE